MSNKKTCFVIMPFSEPYNSRFEDTYKPGIEAAGLRAYRVDEDRTARKPIDSIHKEIEEAHVCFAEISTDKPNVWYELGYARAQRKELVLVCEKSRAINLPFDLDRMRILFHSSNSTKDFNALRSEITEEVRAVMGLVEKVAAAKAVVSQFFMPTATPFGSSFGDSGAANWGPLVPTATTRRIAARKPVVPTAATRRIAVRKPVTPTAATRRIAVRKPVTPTAATRRIAVRKPIAPTVATRGIAVRKPVVPTAAVRKPVAPTAAARGIVTLQASERLKALTGVNKAVASATAAFADANLTPLDVKVMETIVSICSDGKTSALETAIISTSRRVPGLDGKREVKISIMGLERLNMIERVGTGLGDDPTYEPTSAGVTWFFDNRGKQNR